MKQAANSAFFSYRDLFILFLFVIFFYNIGLGSYPLFTPDEGRYSEVAREMIASHDFITPRLNGIILFDKPILHYWLQVLSLSFFGESEWAVRFFPMLSAFILIIATYLFGCYFFDKRSGIFAALILATTPLIFGAAHYANLDLEVACFITLSIYCGTTAFFKASRLFLYLAAITAGLAFLTKGLIGLFFPGVILGFMFFYLRAWQKFKFSQVAFAFLLFAATVLPWYFAVQIKHPNFFYHFFITQHVTRFLSQAEFNNKEPMWFFIPIILIGFFPWSLFLYHGIKKSIMAVIKKQNAILLCLLLAVFTFLIFFSIPHSKLVGYILPIFPPLSLLLGWYISENVTLFKKKFYIASFSVLLLSVAALLLYLPHLAVKINSNSAKTIALALRPLVTEESFIITYNDFFYDLPFYLKKKVQVVADWEERNVVQRDNWRRELLSGKSFQSVDNILLSENKFWQLWQSERLVFVVMSMNDFRTFKTRNIKYYPIKQTSELILLSNNTTWSS